MFRQHKRDANYIQVTYEKCWFYVSNMRNAYFIQATYETCWLFRQHMKHADYSGNIWEMLILFKRHERDAYIFYSKNICMKGSDSFQATYERCWFSSRIIREMMILLMQQFRITDKSFYRNNIWTRNWFGYGRMWEMLIKSTIKRLVDSGTTYMWCCFSVLAPHVLWLFLF